MVSEDSLTVFVTVGHVRGQSCRDITELSQQPGTSLLSSQPQTGRSPVPLVVVYITPRLTYPAKIFHDPPKLLLRTGTSKHERFEESEKSYDFYPQLPALAYLADFLGH